MQEAERIAANERLRNVSFVQGDVEHLRFDDHTFDVTLMRLVLHHASNAGRAVSELVRVTRTGGVVAIVEQGDEFVYPSLPKFFGLLKKKHNLQRENLEIRPVDPGRLATDADLADVRVYPLPYFASQRNSEQLKLLAQSSRIMISHARDSMIDAGVIKAEDYRDGLKELDDWLERDEAFWMALSILTTGRKRTAL